MTVKENKKESIIADMLTENTGSHILDSGRVYGYNYDKNKKRCFRDEQDYTITMDVYRFKDGDIRFECYPTISLYHHLNNTLGDYNEEMNKTFENFVKYYDRITGDDNSWDSLMGVFLFGLSDEEEQSYRGFLASLDTLTVYEEQVLDSITLHNLITSTEMEPQGYTYNEENCLDQDFIFKVFTFNGDQFVFIQTHNGCDARGGFSSPKIFEIEYFQEYPFLYYDGSSTGLLQPEEGVKSTGMEAQLELFPEMVLTDKEYIKYTDIDNMGFYFDGRDWDNDHGLPLLGDFEIKVVNEEMDRTEESIVDQSVEEFIRTFKTKSPTALWDDYRNQLIINGFIYKGDEGVF